MKSPTGSPGRTWSIVLAGGEGKRMRPLVTRWLGRPLPKQYCRFTGTRSMFQHTLDRADALSTPERRVTVFARHHLPEVLTQLEGREPGIFLSQPADRGTAIGVYAALSLIRARDPEAVVAVFPSDHFLHPEIRFAEVMSLAAGAAHRRPDRILLAGAPADQPETEFGWILPGVDASRAGDGLRFRSVRAFREKPDRSEARGLLARGALWNTLILVGHLDVFWGMAHRALRGALPLLDGLGGAAGTSREAAAVSRLYQRVGPANFCRDVLERTPELLGVFGLRGMRWSDWGRPEWILRSLDRLGKEPAFPRELVAEVSPVGTVPTEVRRKQEEARLSAGA
jgi:mannose-1-phosphate guanylyltransferase